MKRVPPKIIIKTFLIHNTVSTKLSHSTQILIKLHNYISKGISVYVNNLSVF